MTDYETWPCPMCRRQIRLDRSGGLRAHTTVSSGQTGCIGSGFNIFMDSAPQLEARGIVKRARKE